MLQNPVLNGRNGRARQHPRPRVWSATLICLSVALAGFAVPTAACAQGLPDDDDKLHNAPPPDPVEEVKKFQQGLGRIGDLGMGLLTGGSGAGLIGRDTKVNGSVAITRGGSLRGAGTNPNQSFMGELGNFRLNLLDLVVDKADQGLTSNRPGLFLRIVDGDVKEQLFSGGGNIAEVYGIKTYRLLGTESQVDFGQFRPEITFDDLTIGSFASKSIGYQFLVPKLSRGVRVGTNLSENSTASVQILNHLENGVWDPRPPMLAASLRSGTPEGVQGLAFLGLQRPSAGWNRPESLGSLAVRWPVSERVSTTIEGVRRSASTRLSPSDSSQSVSLATVYQGARYSSVAVRWDKLRAGVSQPAWALQSVDNLRSATRGESITLSWRLPDTSSASYSLVELRQDWANGSVYGDAASPRRSQATWTFARYFAF
jgi:hypothetical protein